MKSEMDILKMTSPRRVCWLYANRMTLMMVGIVWIGMVIQQLMLGHQPWFLMTMVPSFAIFRFAAYQYYKKVLLK